MAIITGQIDQYAYQYWSNTGQIDQYGTKHQYFFWTGYSGEFWYIAPYRYEFFLKRNLWPRRPIQPGWPDTGSSAYAQKEHVFIPS